MKKLFAAFLITIFSMSYAIAGTFKADAKTRRISAGTIFKIEFIQPVSTSSGMEGDSFAAILKNEISTDSTIVLPAGSIIRGSISSVKTAKRFSRGAKLYLDFDHIVTPNGRQIPLDLGVASYDKIYYDGGLYKNLGYGEAIQKNYEKSKDLVIKTTEYGLNAEDVAYGLQYITTPCCAIGGFFAGAGYYIGQGIADMFRKGQDVYINKGDQMDVKLINPIDVPVY